MHKCRGQRTRSKPLITRAPERSRQGGGDESSSCSECAVSLPEVAVRGGPHWQAEAVQVQGHGEPVRPAHAGPDGSQPRLPGLCRRRHHHLQQLQLCCQRRPPGADHQEKAALPQEE